MSAVVSRAQAPAPPAPRVPRGGSAPPSATLDLLFGALGLWMAAGCLIGSCGRLETLFTPYQVTFCGAAVAGALILGVFARRNRALGFTGRNVLPAAYQAALWGVPLILAGFAADLVRHGFFRIDDSVEPLASPPHLVIGLGILLLAAAPIRSALQQRARLSSLRAQLPLLFGLATWLELIHLGTAFGFDPGAARLYAPPGANGFHPDYFLNTTLALYKNGAGITIVIVQALLLAGFAIWTVARFALRPGALTILFVLGNGMIAAVLTDETPLLFVYVSMSVAAGVAGDLIVARRRACAPLPATLCFVGAFVPGIYYGTYFLMTALTGGVWWSFTLALGAVVWSTICGLALAFLAGGPSLGERDRIPHGE
jgi:hypothetical protein